MMIAAVSPSGLTYEDTYNTLKYADRAKEIRLTVRASREGTPSLRRGLGQAVDSILRFLFSAPRHMNVFVSVILS